MPRNKESIYAGVAIAAIGITGLAAPAEGKRHTKRHTKQVNSGQVQDDSGKRHTKAGKRHT